MIEDTGLDMDLSSGIAAFESKQFTTATRMLAPLAEQGDPEAQYRMAIMAQNGLGMVANPPLAFQYMKAAAESGMGLAQHGLGFMYMQGECVAQDGVKALEWFNPDCPFVKKHHQAHKTMPELSAKYKEWFRKAGFDDF